MQTVTYYKAHENLKAVLNKAADDRAPIMITRQRAENVVLISASEWAGMGDSASAGGNRTAECRRGRGA